MTTIAATLKHMAADSFVGNTDTPYATIKIERIGDSLVGCAGQSAWCRRFLAWRRGETKQPKFNWSEPFRALMLNKTGLYVFENDCVPDRVTTGFHAIGSGGVAALAVLHFGGNATEAVTIACQLDGGSKPPVLTIKL